MHLRPSILGGANARESSPTALFLDAEAQGAPIRRTLRIAGATHQNVYHGTLRKIRFLFPIDPLWISLP